MTEKRYLDAREYLRDKWRLARQVLDSAWRSDYLVGLWRGGAEVGAAVHEFLAAHGLNVRHAPIKCSSYTAIGESAETVTFEFAEAFFAALAPGSRVLIVDDVFDTGRTCAAVKARLAACACEARIACVYWKPEKNVTPLVPDYYVRTCADWLVFPHEMDGLTPAEIRRKDPVLAEIF